MYSTTNFTVYLFYYYIETYKEAHAKGDLSTRVSDVDQAYEDLQDKKLRSARHVKHPHTTSDSIRSIHTFNIN